MLIIQGYRSVLYLKPKFLAVQHLAPVIEAVSDAGVEVDDIKDEVSPIHTPNTTSNISSGG